MTQILVVISPPPLLVKPTEAVQTEAVAATAIPSIPFASPEPQRHPLVDEVDVPQAPEESSISPQLEHRFGGSPPRSTSHQEGPLNAPPPLFLKEDPAPPQPNRVEELSTPSAPQRVQAQPPVTCQDDNGAGAGWGGGEVDRKDPQVKAEAKGRPLKVKFGTKIKNEENPKKSERNSPTAPTAKRSESIDAIFSALFGGGAPTAKRLKK
jgi:hypothetical protein